MSDCILFDLTSYKMTEIVFSDSSGAYPQSKQFNQALKFSGYAIGYFEMNSGERGGTGFVIKIISLDSALIITAGHVFFNQFKFEPSQADFILGGEAYLAEPIRTSVMWDNLDYASIDPISNEPISISDDWTICLIKKKPGMHYSCNLRALELSDRVLSFSPGEKVHLIGFPKTFNQNDLYYISPEANRSKFDKILDSLCSANTLIDSKGEIIEEGEMIAISCTSANGMSGSPLIIKEKGRYVVVGLLHGGPASKIHNLVARVFSSSVHSFTHQMHALLDYLSFKASQYIIDSKRNQLLSFITFMNSFTALDDMSREVLLIIYKMAHRIEIESGCQLKYNLAVPLRTIYSDIIKF